MRTIELETMLTRIRARKRELGIDDGPEAAEALRNAGDLRTPEKRGLLRRVDRRARAAGKAPLPARY